MGIEQTLSSDRYEFDDNITKSELVKLVSNINIKYLQTAIATKKKTFELINDYFIAKRPDVQLRFGLNP